MKSGKTDHYKKKNLVLFLTFFPRKLLKKIKFVFVKPQHLLTCNIGFTL